MALSVYFQSFKRLLKFHHFDGAFAGDGFLALFAFQRDFCCSCFFWRDCKVLGPLTFTAATDFLLEEPLTFLALAGNCSR